MSEGKLEAALAWAARDLRVFPLQTDSKEPLDLGWTLHATTDPDVIRGWWTDPVTGFERDLNIAFLTTGWAVLDVDVKDGKAGLATFAELGLDFDTLTVRTPSNGYHLYYRNPGFEVGAGHLLRADDGIDVRGLNGYLVAPGSTIGGVPYVVEIDAPVAEFPAHLVSRLKRPKQRAEASAVSLELDQPEMIVHARHYLEREAPIARQGANGDDTTYSVCCSLRDFGVSEPTALELLLELYNPRCEPPWSPDEAEAKVGNAYRYAKGAAGARSAEAAFGDVVSPLSGLTSAPAVVSRTMWVCDGPDAPPAWLVEGVLPRDGIAFVAGQTGAGKTFVAVDTAVAVMTGSAFMGGQVKRTGGVLWLAAEGHNEVPARFKAAAANRGVSGGLAALPCRYQCADTMLPALKAGSAFEELRELVAETQAALAERFQTSLALIVVDTLGMAAGFQDENSNSEVNGVMAMLRRLAVASGALVVLVDHFGKAEGAGIRGASAKAGAADAILTVKAEKKGVVTTRHVSIEKLRFGRADGDPLPFALKQIVIDGREAHCAIDWTTLASAAAVDATQLDPFQLIAIREACADGTARADASAEAWVGKRIAKVFGVDADKDKLLLKDVVARLIRESVLVEVEGLDRSRKPKRFVRPSSSCGTPQNQVPQNGCGTPLQEVPQKPIPQALTH